MGVGLIHHKAVGFMIGKRIKKEICRHGLRRGRMILGHLDSNTIFGVKSVSIKMGTRD